MKAKNYFNAAKIEELTTKGKIAYSIYEAAGLVGVSPNHLKNEHQRGKLRFVRSGKRLLILDTDLRRYLEEQAIDQV
jgi:excisionase family DNA binding protein